MQNPLPVSNRFPVSCGRSQDAEVNARNKSYSLFPTCSLPVTNRRKTQNPACDNTHETGVTIWYGHWVPSRDISHETGGTSCYRHWLLRLMTTYTKQEVGVVAGIGVCVF